MKRALWGLLGGALALTASLQVQAAASISSVYQWQGGGTWLASFKVQNEGLPGALDWFTVYFPETQFSNLVLLSSPNGWDTLVIQPDVSLSSAGMFDSLAFDSGVPSGGSQGGFRMSFSYFGEGAPGSLAFDINDKDLNVIFSGQTVAEVPEPSGLLLAALGVAALWGPRKLKAVHRKQEEVSA